jgi:hypothetical protein
MHSLFHEEINVSIRLGFDSMPIEWYGMLRNYKNKHNVWPTLDEALFYHYTPCEPNCINVVPREDIIPILIHCAIECNELPTCDRIKEIHEYQKKYGTYPKKQESYSYPSTIEQTCIICQESIKKGDYVISLPCTHTFHSKQETCEGIDTWLTIKVQCPLCKIMLK